MVLVEASVGDNSDPNQDMIKDLLKVGIDPPPVMI